MKLKKRIKELEDELQEMKNKMDELHAKIFATENRNQ